MVKKEINFNINGNANSSIKELNKELNSTPKKLNDIKKSIEDNNKAFKNIEKNASNVNKAINTAITSQNKLTEAQKRFNNALKESTKERQRLKVIENQSFKNQFKSNFANSFARDGLSVSGLFSSIKAAGLSVEKQKFLNKRGYSDEKQIELEESAKETSARFEELKKLKGLSAKQLSKLGYDKYINKDTNSINENALNKDIILAESQKNIAEDALEQFKKNKDFSGKMFDGFIKTGSNAVKKLGSTMVSVMNAAGISFKGIFNDVLKEISSVFSKETGAGTFDLVNTIFSNATARNQAMRYGLSSSQNYALTQTMSMLGMRSDEDLMYMNPTQRQKFTELMTKYSNWYDQLQSTGILQKVQESQLELSMLKQEIAYKFLNWFGDNKEAIFTAVDLILKAVQAIANIIIKILNLINIGKTNYTNPFDSAAKISDATNSSSNITNNMYFNMNNTNNVSTTTNQSELESILNRSNNTIYKNVASIIDSKI